LYDLKVVPRVRIPASPPISCVLAIDPSGDPAGLQNVSKALYGQRLIQQPNCAIERRWTQVHVALRHAQFPVSSELLNRSRRCAAHRQVRTERVPQNVHAILRQLHSTRRAQQAVTDETPRPSVRRFDGNGHLPKIPGYHRAPNAVPNSAVVTVSATAVADSTRTASAAVTVSRR
jgi:hypothetical protein